MNYPATIRNVSILSALLLLFTCQANLETSELDQLRLTFVLLSGPNVDPGPVADLRPLRTYQTDCWDENGNPTGCEGTGQDGEHQAGRAALFIGPEAHETYTDDYTTTDYFTNLVWQSCSLGHSGEDCLVGTAEQMDWDMAGMACDALNADNNGAGYAGRTDWRLPEVKELLTIKRYDDNTPKTFATAFPETMEDDYWSRSPYMQNPTGQTWAVDFNEGGIGGWAHFYEYYVRCVSGEPLSASVSAERYIDQGDGTVSDVDTELLWQRCSRGRNQDPACSGDATESNWADALTYCNTLELGSRDDWRLPNINELSSIMDYGTYEPAINTAAFPGAGTEEDYWTGSTIEITTASARRVGSYDGTLYAGGKSILLLLVRFVTD